MKTNGKKRGRKSKPHRTADGVIINGLRKRPSDGRWELSDGRTFVEDDEPRAIVRFYEMTGADRPKITRENSPMYDILRGFTLLEDMPGSKAEDRMWKWFGAQISERPKFVAMKTGHEQIAYLKKMKPPAPLPSLDSIQETWMTFAKCSVEQKKKAKKGFIDFRETTGIKGIDDITPEIVVAYQDDVHARGLSGKQQQHIFGGARRLLTFAKSRAQAVDEITKALSYMALLKPSESGVSLDPKPIDVADWQKLLAKAEGDDTAMILLMLNGAFYLTEVINLEWEDFDFDKGVLITHRRKTGKCVRVCVLWEETKEVLNQMKRKGSKLFYTYAGLPIKVSGAMRRFKALADAAAVNVTASQLRDGAFTAAVAANVSTSLCNLLVGHRCGIQDSYVKRQPDMVKPAIDAIYSHYMT